MVYMVEISEVLPVEISVKKVEIFNFHWKKKSCLNNHFRRFSSLMGARHLEMLCLTGILMFPLKNENTGQNTTSPNAAHT